jgi:hypothetical protein
VGYAFRKALDRNLRIIPILVDPEVADPPRLPAMIAHLKALDFTQEPEKAWSDLLSVVQGMKFSQELSLLGLSLVALLLFLVSRR